MLARLLILVFEVLVVGAGFAEVLRAAVLKTELAEFILIFADVDYFLGFRQLQVFLENFEPDGRDGRDGLLEHLGHEPQKAEIAAELLNQLFGQKRCFMAQVGRERLGVHGRLAVHLLDLLLRKALLQTFRARQIHRIELLFGAEIPRHGLVKRAFWRELGPAEADGPGAGLVLVLVDVVVLEEGPPVGLLLGGLVRRDRRLHELVVRFLGN